MHGRSTWFRRSSGPRTSCSSPLWHQCRGQTCHTSTSWHGWSTPTSSRWRTLASCQSRRSHSWRERLPFSYGPPRSFTQRRTPCNIVCQYSSESAYDTLFQGPSTLLGAKELCKSKAPNKCHFSFGWLCRAVARPRRDVYNVIFRATTLVHCVVNALKPVTISLQDVASAGRYGSRHSDATASSTSPLWVATSLSHGCCVHAKECSSIDINHLIPW
jgi:hypothetical protein